MNAGSQIVLGLFGGGALGTFFFAGLWWTVNRLTIARLPGMLLAGSLLLRMTVALLGFYCAARGGSRPLLACLLGFVLARIVVARWLRPRAVAPKGLAP